MEHRSSSKLQSRYIKTLVTSRGVFNEFHTCSNLWVFFPSMISHQQCGARNGQEDFSPTSVHTTSTPINILLIKSQVTTSTRLIVLVFCVASWSSGRHLALGSGGPGFESWLCQVDVESLGKALSIHFLTPLMCKTSTPL